MIERNTKPKKPISPNNPNQTENQGGRPSKIEGFLVGMEKVLMEGQNAIILTDEELFILANDELEEKDQISYTTFKVYKASKDVEEKEGYNRFQSLYKKALTNQKKNLFNKLGDDSQQQWQRYAWIIERKFSDWNLKQISESKTQHSGELTLGGLLNELGDSTNKLIDDGNKSA